MRNQDFLKMIEKLHRQEGNSKWKMWAALGIIGLTGLSVYLWRSGKKNEKPFQDNQNRLKMEVRLIEKWYSRTLI